MEFIDEKEDKRVLQIVKKLSSSRKCIIVTGAGISVSSGIPDFRSKGGLYDVVKEKYPESVIRGQDLFDGGFFMNPSTRKIFLHFISQLKVMCDSAKPTATHHFLKWMEERKQVQRVYTQNIDGLEKECGFSDQLSKNNPVVPLHGTLQFVICTICKKRLEMTTLFIEIYDKGSNIDCPECVEKQTQRKKEGKRKTAQGILRPDIVLYNEPHPHGEIIADIVSTDIKKRPDLLIVMGTSLKVNGLKRLVKDLAKAVKQHSNGSVLFINKSEAAKNQWNKVFDYQFVGDCDEWTSVLKEKVLQFEKKPVQTKIDSYFPVVKASGKEKKIKSKKAPEKSEKNSAEPNKDSKENSKEISLETKKETKAAISVDIRKPVEAK